MILRWLISALGFAALKGETASIAHRIGRSVMLYAILAILWLTALGFALAAFAIWLAGQLGAPAACAIIAAALAVIGLAIQVAMALSSRRRKPEPTGFHIPGLTGADGVIPGIDGSNL